MKTKYTPGPWRMHTRRAQEKGETTEYLIYSDSGCSEITIGNRNLVDKNPRFLHDARLIAAAPDMLEALEMVTRMFPKEMRGSVVEAAIKKAKGE